MILICHYVEDSKFLLINKLLRYLLTRGAGGQLGDGQTDRRAQL